MWLKMATNVRKVATKVFSVCRQGKHEGKDTWWWNNELQGSRASTLTRMPEEWRRSVLVRSFENKRDVQNCTNYHGIKWFIHTMMHWFFNKCTAQQHRVLAKVNLNINSIQSYHRPKKQNKSYSSSSSVECYTFANLPLKKFIIIS